MTKTRLFLIASTTFLTLVSSQQLLAQGVPARIFGSGSFNSSDLSFCGEANGNHLGNCSFAGAVSQLVALDETGLYLGYVVPTDIYTAANGDTLELRAIGTVTLTPVGLTDSGEPVFTALWDGTWTVIPGGANTGRFENASGTFELTAENLPFAFSDPFWFFTYEKNGELDLGKRN